MLINLPFLREPELSAGSLFNFLFSHGVVVFFRDDSISARQIADTNIVASSHTHTHTHLYTIIVELSRRVHADSSWTLINAGFRISSYRDSRLPTQLPPFTLKEEVMVQ